MDATTFFFEQYYTHPTNRAATEIGQNIRYIDW